MNQEKKRLTPLQKIEKINQQIEKLKQQQQKVQKTFEAKIANLLKKEKAYTHDFNILYGAILDVSQKLNDSKNNQEQISNWEKIGSSALVKKQKSEIPQSKENEHHSNSDDAKNRKTLKPKYSIS